MSRHHFAALALLAAATLTGSVASADQVFTITADSTIGGTAGVLMNVEDPPGDLSRTEFLVTQAGRIRVHATRMAGSPTWTIHPVAIYRVTKNTIAPGDTWRYVDEADGSETIASAILEESVDTPAGTFLAWRIDVARTSNPAKLVRSVWYADDLGIVREVVYFDQWIQWESLLDNYSVAGNGHFPLIVGNMWYLRAGAVSAQSGSVSALKSQYGGQ